MLHIHLRNIIDKMSKNIKLINIGPHNLTLEWRLQLNNIFLSDEEA